MTPQRLLVGGCLVTVLACGGDTTGPGDSVPSQAIPIVVGDTLVQAFAAGDTVARFIIRSAAPIDVAVFAQSELGNFALGITDSVTGELLGQGQAFQDPASGHLMLNRTNTVPVGDGRVLLLEVFSLQPNAPARVRLLVHRVNRAPEIAPNSFAVGDTIVGETLENIADIDDFVFQAAAGGEFIAYLQGEEGVIPGELILHVTSPDGTERLAAVANAAGDVELEAQATARFIVPEGGNYRVEVGYPGVLTVTPELPGTGSYRFVVRAIDRDPEHAPVLLAPGDTLTGEAIEYVGDVDEFQIPVVADSAYNVFAQMQGSSENAELQLTVVAGGQEIAFLTSSVGDTALAGRFTGNFTAAATGTVTVRVLCPSERLGIQRGPYRLFVYPVNRAPELVPASIAPGDSIAETIEFPGDIDKFTLSRPSTGVVNVILHRGATSAEWLDLTWSPAAGNETLNCYHTPPSTEAGCATGRVVLAGALPLTVASALGATTSFRGGYSLVALAIDTTPEVPSQIVLNQTIQEELNPRGDLDIYQLPYSEGTLIELVGSGGGTLNDPIDFSFEDPDGAFMGGYAGGFPINSGRMTLRASGTYRLRVSGSATVAPTPYTVEVRTVGSATEAASASLSPGDSVSSETINALGDVDDFLINAAPGTEVQVFLREGSFQLYIDPIVAGTNTLIRTGTQFNTGRLTVPGSGQVGIRIYEPRSFSSGLRDHGFSFTGPYSVSVHQIDRAPETLTAALTLGTTMDGEALDIEGDVDEYTFSGTAGQQVSASVSAPFALDVHAEVMLELIDPSTGAVLGSAASFDGSVHTTGTISLPGTRTYMVRLSGSDSTRGKGGYRFIVQ